MSSQNKRALNSPNQPQVKFPSTISTPESVTPFFFSTPLTSGESSSELYSFPSESSVKTLRMNQSNFDDEVAKSKDTVDLICTEVPFN